jgi:hypothetical protein
MFNGFSFSHHQGRKMEPSVRPSIQPSDKAHLPVSQNHNHDANSTAANTPTTDAGDKTEHIIMTAMQ